MSDAIKVVKETKEVKEAAREDSSPRVLGDFLWAFFGPVLINKIFMLYFGLHYAEYPGEGYGYGLAASIAFFFFTVGRFLWKYRNVEDP